MKAPHLQLFHLVEKLKCPLLRLEPRLMQTLQCLLARRVLLAANNTPLLGLHQILLSQTTTGVLGRSVKHLRLCANRGNLCTAHHHLVLPALHVLATHHLVLPPLHGVLAPLHALTTFHLTSRVHLYIKTLERNPRTTSS